MKSMKRISAILVGAALLALGACANSETKAVTTNPQAEATEACCESGAEKSCCADGAASDACATETGSCCSEAKKTEP